MFLNGINTVSENKLIPWYQDGTYSHISQLFTKLKFASRYRSAENVIKHPQIESMLFLLSHYNQQINFYLFEYNALELDMPQIINIKGTKEFPDQLVSTSYMYNEQNIGFKIIQSTKNNRSFFPALDEIKPDLKPISMVLQNNVNHKVRVYADKNNPNRYTIVTSAWSWDMARTIIALMPKLFPQITLPDKILDIFRLFGTEHYEEWCQAYNDWIQSLHLLDELKKTQLKEALNRTKNIKLQRFEKEMQDYRQSIENFISNIRDYYRALDDVQLKHLALSNQPELDASEFFNYLTKNKAIREFTVSAQNLILVIKVPWNYYDQAAFDRIANNERSRIHNDVNLANFFKRTYVEKPQFELWTEATITINLQENNFNVSSTDKCKLLPQTHLHHFNCWGNNRALIQKALSSYDYVGTIEQLVAATKSINWLDSTVTGELCTHLATTYKKRPTIKVLATGEFINYLQVIDLINKEKEIKQNEVHPDNGGTATEGPGEIPNIPTNQPIF